MEIPAAVTGEKPRISVWLSNKHSDQIKFFRCTVCGHKVFGYYDEVKILMAGEGEFKNKSPIVIQCNGSIDVEENMGRSQVRMVTKRCKTVYVIG